MKKSRIFSTGLAVAVLAAGGYAFSKADTSREQLSSVQLKTLETLTENENNSSLDIPCEPEQGAVCSVPVRLSNGAETTMTVLNCKNS